MTQEDVLPVLRLNEFLKNVPESQLDWLIEHSGFTCLDPGEYLFRKGDPADYMYIVLSGKISLYVEQNGSKRDLGAFEEGEVTGILPYSRMKQASGFAVAAEDSCYLATPRTIFPEMIRTQYELVEALVHVMTSRVREFTEFQQQNEKMMALGRMSAGLAHELNNPASAIVRSSDELKKHLQKTPEEFKKVLSVKLTGEQIDLVNTMLFDCVSDGCANLSLMQRTAMEDELADWLLDHGVPNAYEMAADMTEFEFTVEDLEMILRTVGPDSLEPVLKWIENSLVTEKLVEDIELASRRISELVSSVKSYTHMDRGTEKQEADIHLGIRNTLTLLNHKLKKANVKYVETFDESLPHPMVYVSEMNQVWTNLLDNAIDAMETQGGGTLEIRTSLDREFIRVDIIDSGPGIPADIQGQIFDPFFTTKEVGKGTGLGLDVVSRIIQQHKGSIKVKSVPGRTEFQLCFPIR